jgi:hypothetical protein
MFRLTDRQIATYPTSFLANRSKILGNNTSTKAGEQRQQIDTELRRREEARPRPGRRHLLPLPTRYARLDPWGMPGVDFDPLRLLTIRHNDDVRRGGVRKSR